MEPDPSKRKNISIEDPQSFLDSIKNEWHLFWHGILGDDKVEEPVDPFETGNLKNLNVEQIKQITRALSQDRRKLNQHIELLNRELDANAEVLENLKLVGSKPDDTIDKIGKLSDVGFQLSLQLNRVDEQLRKFRDREDHLSRRS